MNSDWTDRSAYLPLALAAALVLWRPLWNPTRHVVTLAHEAGHALAAVATGRRLTGIRLHSDTSGLTLSRGRPRGPGMIVTAAAGFLAPALLGLLGAALISTGRLPVLLWGAVTLIVVMVPFIRNAFGFVVLLVVGVAVGVVAYPDRSYCNCISATPRSGCCSRGTCAPSRSRPEAARAVRISTSSAH